VSSLSSPTSGGLALKGNDSKSIYFFERTKIHRFNPETKVTVELSTVLPSGVQFAAGITINQSAFLFTIHSGVIQEFNMQSETVKIIGDLWFGDVISYSTASITDSSSNTVWLFPGSDEKHINRSLIFDPETKLTSTSPYQNERFASLNQYPATVSTGRYGYIIGGIGRTPNPDGSKYSSNGILR
jgi:hypothetical protein